MTVAAPTGVLIFGMGPNGYPVPFSCTGTGEIDLPFKPISKGTPLSVSSTSSNVSIGEPVEQIQILNDSNNIAFVAFGSDNTVTASAGTAGDTASCDYPVAPGACVVITFSNSLIETAVWAAGILTEGTGTLYFTPGKGS